jgi:hypothetical protein
MCPEGCLSNPLHHLSGMRVALATLSTTSPFLSITSLFYFYTYVS